MRSEKLDNNTHDKFIDAMLELVLEKGGLTNVNLRMVAKKIGCAHTNAYNYFDGYQGLVYEAYDKALILYGLAVIDGLDDVSDGGKYFIRFIKNIINFALKYPGYYRFIGSDDFDIAGLEMKTIQKAIELKSLFMDVFYAVTASVLNKADAETNSNILMSYIDGELFNIINKRAFPEDNVEERIVENSVKLISLFTANGGKGINLYDKLTLEFIPQMPSYLID